VIIRSIPFGRQNYSVEARMLFWRSISMVLGFRTVPITVLLILIYAAVFSTVLVTDELPDVPKDQGGLDLVEAYADLHQVCPCSIHI